MEMFKIENLTFSYPTSSEKALDDVSIAIDKGEFLVICGESGSGKTTLLKHLKPTLKPIGGGSGKIYFQGAEISSYTDREQAQKIGFVMQNPSNQIVCDKVWHEIAFGLESIGMPPSEIRTRVAEVCSFFSIEDWFYKNTNELSGGMLQILNLASVIALNPSVIILDEPTSQLSPTASETFFSLLCKINRELGITVILSEHRLGEVLSFADRVCVMDKGKVVALDTPRSVATALKGNELLGAFPVPMQVFASVDDDGISPLTIREGRDWLLGKEIKRPIKDEQEKIFSDKLIEAKNIHFRYEKNLPDVISGLLFSVSKGEICSVLGGNGSGKTTLLMTLCGLLPIYSGKIKKKGKLAYLPQMAESLFLKNTVFDDLCDVAKREEVQEILDKFKISHLADRHPNDLSGGELQRVAIIKVLLTKPDVLLLDEPTKGLDEKAKYELYKILKDFVNEGKAVVLVSHDIEFSAEYSDRCAYLFDGKIISEGTPREFFGGKNFYTTSANKMSRGIIENAILPQDIVYALGGETV